MEYDRPFNEFFDIQILPFILSRNSLSKDQMAAAVPLKDFTYQMANNDTELKSDLEPFLFIFNNKYYEFKYKSRITKRYVGEDLLMLVILKPKKDDNLINCEIKFNYNDTAHNKHGTLRRIAFKNWDPKKLLYFTGFIELTSTEYQLVILATFRYYEKKADQEIRHDVMLKPREFKLSPKVALGVNIEYAWIKRGEDDQLLVQIQLNNEVNFPIKVVKLFHDKKKAFYTVDKMLPDVNGLILEGNSSFG